VLLGVLPGPWITPILLVLQAASAAAYYPAGFAWLSLVFPLSIRHVAVSAVFVLAALIGAGGVPPLVGVLADHFSFSVAFAAAGGATLASLCLFRLVSSHDSGRRASTRTDRPAPLE
jgi:NNP family nitrate/nitrite transporter-like MFS transporter